MFEPIKAYVAQFKMYFAIAVVALSFFGGMAVMYKVIHGEVTVLKSEISACRQANKDNEATVEKMIDAREKAKTSCEKQLAIARRTADNNRKYDNLLGGGNEQTGGGNMDNSGGSGNSGGDPLRDAFNGMFPAAGN